MRRVGVLLSGCGRYDGSEVQETVLLVLALRRRGLRPVFLAPDAEQRDVVDHTTGTVVESAAARQVLHEGARLTRGVIRPLHEVSASELDALVIPGGSGVLKNLCEPNGGLGAGALRGDVRRLLDGLRERSAPVAAVGLGELVLARHEGRPLSDLPITMQATGIVADRDRRVLFTPGFVGTDEITEAAEGIERLVGELAGWLGGSEGRE